MRRRTMPLGAAVGGLLADLFGMRAVFATMALLCLSLSVVLLRITDADLDAADRMGDPT